MRKDPDPEVLHRDDIRTRSSGARRLIIAQGVDEVLVIVRDDDSTRQGSSDEKESEAEVDGLERPLEVLARVRRFAGHHGDVLGPDDCEAGCRCQPTA